MRHPPLLPLKGSGGFPVLACLVRHELRGLLRHAGIWRQRLLAGAIAALVAVLLLLIGFYQPSVAIRDFFRIAIALLAGYAAILSLTLACDSLAEDRRCGILAMLRLAPVSPLVLILSKLASRALAVGHALLGLVPVLALAVVFGGIGPAEILGSFLFLFHCLLLSLSAGLFFSSILRGAGPAFLLSLFFLGSLALVPWLEGTGRTAFWERFSPSAALAASRGPLPELLACLACGLLLACALLWLAGLLLHRSTGGGIRVSLPAGRHAWIPARQGENPVFRLLCNQHRRTLRARCLILAAALALILAASWARGPAGLLLPLMACHVLFKLHVAWAASLLACSMRRSGMLENMLSTPLPWPLALEGWLAGLKRSLAWAFLLLVALDLGCLFLLPGWPAWAWLALPMLLGLVADSWALAWAGLALGATSGSAPRAWAIAGACLVAAPWFLAVALLALGPGLQPSHLLWSRFLIGLVAALLASSLAADRIAGLHRERLAR